MIRVAFRPRRDRVIHVASEAYGTREFEWTGELAPVARGRLGELPARRGAAGRAGSGEWHGEMHMSDLPAAAGLSSSSALIVAFTLCLLRANGRALSFEELMEMLPDGEQFVGTRGGGMDHAASLASKAGCASLVEFEPLAVRHIPIPRGLGFLVAHSMQTAEKSGAARGGVQRARGNAPADAERHVPAKRPACGAAVEACGAMTLPASDACCWNRTPACAII